MTIFNVTQYRSYIYQVVVSKAILSQYKSIFVIFRKWQERFYDINDILYSILLYMQLNILKV